MTERKQFNPFNVPAPNPDFADNVGYLKSRAFVINPGKTKYRDSSKDPASLRHKEAMDVFEERQRQKLEDDWYE